MNLTVSHRPSPTTLVAGSLPTAGIPVAIVDPWSNRYVVTSGSKPEHGPGGFEVLIPTPGQGYLARIAGQDYPFDHGAGLTFLAFSEDDPREGGDEPAPPEPPPPPPPPADPCPHDWFQAALLGYLALIAADLDQIHDYAYWLYVKAYGKEPPP